MTRWFHLALGVSLVLAAAGCKGTKAKPGANTNARPNEKLGTPPAAVPLPPPPSPS